MKIKLSVLWVARMLSGLQGNSTRLHDLVALRDLVAGTSRATSLAVRRKTRRTPSSPWACWAALSSRARRVRLVQAVPLASF
ncbi:MAG TPA: hypothetical protein VFZ76_06875 [Anaerolineales bacterium]